MDSHQLNVFFQKYPLSARLWVRFAEFKDEEIKFDYRLLPDDRYMTCPPSFKTPTHFRNKIKLTFKSGRTTSMGNIKRNVLHIHMTTAWGEFQRHLGKFRSDCMVSHGLFLFILSLLWTREFRSQSMQAQLLGTQWRWCCPPTLPFVDLEKEEGLLWLSGFKFKSR